MCGELDLASAASVEDELTAVEATDARQIVLDLSGLTFMDSSGVHLIARADARCRAAAKPLRLLRGPPHIHRVFELAVADTLPFVA
ncbi:MAG: STAS domain-containing protein [Actinobacteria bacterium]|nr:STAS domain-containing protein [Actinomycetota bacterium]